MPFRERGVCAEHLQTVDPSRTTDLAAWKCALNDPGGIAQLQACSPHSGRRESALAGTVITQLYLLCAVFACRPKSSWLKPNTRHDWSLDAAQILLLIEITDLRKASSGSGEQEISVVTTASIVAWAEFSLARQTTRGAWDDESQQFAGFVL